MKFGEAIKSFFKNYATFKGRARRSEFWYAVLFTLLVSVAVDMVFPGTTQVVNGYEIQQQSGISNLWSLAIFVPSLAITWRRLHDVNKSGPYFFFIFIPIAGAIMLLVQLVKDGSAGPNKFGEPVK
ncbi:MAG: hypothetical protein RL556_368 [Actinomycetota bacterium]|jgi:uncharacterized membrane protein YhaH (DUF805 family)